MFQRYLLWFCCLPGYQAPPLECHMAAIVASSSSSCSMFDNGYQRRNNRQQTLVGQHGRPGHHHHHQHYHHHRHYCNSHYYHHRSRPVAVSRGEARRGSLLSAADVGGAGPSTPTIITTTSTSPTTTTTSMAGTFTAISNQQVPPSLVQPGSHSIAPPHQSSLPMTRRASSTGPTRRCTFAPSVNGGGGLRNGSRRLRRQSSSVASFAVDQERLPARPVLPPPP
uniref:Uncharacterized protein n=1 Tax=Anopheles atroparvus TaxID=41427 RepID=A0A182IYI6_ANOAO